MLCRNAWIPPGRGGKSLVTIRVLCIAADPTERASASFPGRTHTKPGHASRPLHRRTGDHVPHRRAARRGADRRRRTGTDRDSRGSDGHDGLSTAPVRTADALGRHPAAPAAVRLQGVRVPGPGRHQRRLGDLPGLVRDPAHRNVSPGRRHLAVPARRRPRDPLPALLPFLDYASAFFVLAFLADLAVLALLLYAGARPGKSWRGAWVWAAGLPCSARPCTPATT